MKSHHFELQFPYNVKPSELEENAHDKSIFFYERENHGKWRILSLIIHGIQRWPVQGDMCILFYLSRSHEIIIRFPEFFFFFYKENAKNKIHFSSFFLLHIKKKVQKTKFVFASLFFFYKKNCKKRKINSFPRDNQPIKFFHYVVRTR